MTPPTFDGFHVRAVGARGELVLDRADHLNPLSTRTLFDIEAAARWFDEQREIRVVVVRGEGRAFSAGADVSAFGVDGSDGPVEARDVGDAGRRAADALESMRAVLIAQLHGHCVGGGLVLAAACDLRIAAEGTRFAIPEVDLGIPLAWGGIPRLVREIGPARTKELVMTCRPFFADEALATGFLNRVVPEDALAAAVDELADSIAAKPRFAVQATKAGTNAVTASMIGVARSWNDAEALLAGLRDPEGRESAARYLGKLSGD